MGNLKLYCSLVTFEAMKKALVLFIFITNQFVWANNKDTLKTHEAEARIKVICYERIIFNSKGTWRTDQNLLGNFQMIHWLRLEAGIRFGEQPSAWNAYTHYKLELQSKWFYNTFRTIARLSNDVVNSPLPTYRKTNEIFVTEIKHALSQSLHIMAGGGYVVSFQENNNNNILPTNSGIQNNYPVYKISLKYIYKKSEIEMTYGSYDVFNPYLYNKPFVQTLGMYNISNKCKLQGYFRYQYNKTFDVPENYFISLGAIFRL